MLNTDGPKINKALERVSKISQQELLHSQLNKMYTLPRNGSVKELPKTCKHNLPGHIHLSFSDSIITDRELHAQYATQVEFAFVYNHRR